MRVKLAENIKKFRKERKMTQEQLAEAMGVSVSAKYISATEQQIQECDSVKKQNVGFAFLLLGIIFAVTQETLFWWIGVLLGIIGFIIVLYNSKRDN